MNHTSICIYCSETQVQWFPSPNIKIPEVLTKSSKNNLKNWTCVGFRKKNESIFAQTLL